MIVSFCALKISNMPAKLAARLADRSGSSRLVGLSAIRVSGSRSARRRRPSPEIRISGREFLSPIFTFATVPAGASTVVALTELRASSALAMSHELVNFAVPVGLNWNEQSAGSAMIVTCAFSCAGYSAGLAVAVSSLNSGK